MLLRFKGDSGGKSRPNFELLVTVKFGECRRMSERVRPVTKRLIYFQRSAARPSRTSRESGVKKSQQRNRKPSTYVGRPKNRLIRCFCTCDQEGKEDKEQFAGIRIADPN